jgi:hypothetical protein
MINRSMSLTDCFEFFICEADYEYDYLRSQFYTIIFRKYARLTTKQYLKTHTQLRRLWLRDNSLFAELSPREQRLLHDFFKPDKDWSDLELLQHRDAITAQRPSLPHQAGRALNRFWETTANLAARRVRAARVPAAPARRVRQQDRHIVVKSLVRPEIDAQKLARAFINLAISKQERKLQEEGDQDRSRP